MTAPGQSGPEDDSLPAPSDRSLLRRLRAGNDDAATQLYLRYASRLRVFAHAKLAADIRTLVDGDDLVQSVFRTFFRRADRDHYDVPEGDDLWRLFLVIALNKIRNAGTHHRAAKRDVGATRRGDAYEIAITNAAGAQEGLVELRLVIDEILENLPADHRRMIELRIDGHEVAEIARQTERSKRSVERILQSFRAHAEAVLFEEIRQ